MISPSTIKHAKRAAAMTLDSNLMIGTRDNTPVDILRNHYLVPGQGLRRELSYKGIDKLTRSFTETLEASHVATVSEEKDDLVSLATQGARNMLKVIRGAVVPACKRVHSEYEGYLSQVNKQPQIEVKPQTHHAIHSNHQLLSHLEGYPRKHRLKTGYRTFLFDHSETSDHARLIDMMADTPIVEEAEVRAWALESLGSNTLEYVWSTLFDQSRHIDPRNLSFTRMGGLLPLDELLAGYFLTSYYHDHPMTVRGESVTLEEWEATFKELHGMFALLLLEQYERRERYRRQGRVILRSDVGDNSSVAAYYEGAVSITTNGDLIQSCLDNGMNIKAILGAAITSPGGLLNVKQIMERQDELVAAWERKHRLIRTAFKAQTINGRRQKLESCVAYGSIAGDEEGQTIPLPSLTDQEREERTRNAMARLKETDLDDTWTVVTRLVCEIYYPTQQYHGFLMTMQRYGTTVDAREAATFATIEVMAQWLAAQLTRHEVVQDIAKTAEKGSSDVDASMDA